MATVEQANTYHAARGNEDWSDLDPVQATALLEDAEEYITNRYPIRYDLTEDEQRKFDHIVCRLAGIFQTNPPEVAASSSIKKESKELAGMKKEVEYVAAGPDPYPYITAVVGSFLRSASTGITVGRLRRL